MREPLNEPRPGLTPFDTTVHTRAATRATEQQARRAALVICDLAGTPDDALAPLAALDLIDPYTPLPATADAGANLRKLSGNATHGTASGLSWHQRTRVPLCGLCRGWANRDENGAR